MGDVKRKYRKPKPNLSFEIPKLSTGHSSTLGSYRDLCKVTFGEDSKQIKFIDDHINKSPNGRDEEVIIPESQMVHLLSLMG